VNIIGITVAKTSVEIKERTDSFNGWGIFKMLYDYEGNLVKTLTNHKVLENISAMDPSPYYEALQRKEQQ
jgi:hypothetical protein